jgi:formylglycine-generating enzyme required for sulfatase activity/energy-coupling factor transporter ATP-binding protein EcfA2
MTEAENKVKSSAQASDNSIAVGSIEIGGDVSGSIHVGNVGYTVEEVSALLTEITSTFQSKPFDGRCPYKGLDVFEEEDSELFFGREKLVDDLVNRVKESRTVFITGPSGSGKSSLVRAGLIHALKQGAIKSSERWLYATMKPGRDPIGELGRVASTLAGSTNAEDEIRAKAVADATIFARWCEIALKEGRDKRVVLFIDQFEEVFTQISKETERVAFLNLLTHAATVENGRVIVLFSMRSDFVSNCATYPQINALLNQQFVQIGAMQPEELVSAIAQPALRVGLRIDPDLIAQVINDMKGEPGALPLMQFALKDLFDSQQGKSGAIALTLNDYLQRGGIHKALERHADDSFSKLSKNEQELARSIFSGLIEIGRGTQDTRRTALFDELVPANANAADVGAIVQKLADARLITTDEAAGKDTVTISHEKLIDAWPWLRKLVNENREAIALQNKIAEDAKEWEEHGRDASYLYSGVRLINAREKLATKSLSLSGNAYEFVKAAQAQQLRGQWRRVAAVVLTLITLSMIAAWVTPTIQEWRAKKQAPGALVKISEGDFYMGATDPKAIETGERTAWLAHLPAFYIEKYEVSNRQYGLCVKYGGCTLPGDLAGYWDPQKQEYPVLAVHVDQASAYCQWIGRRLPTDMEWIRAARGINDRRLWPWDDTPPTSELANMPYAEDMNLTAQPVENYPQNRSPEGAQNLIGNALEWTSSYYQKNYQYGNAPYDNQAYWNEQIAAYDSKKVFVRLGGGWQRLISHLAEAAPIAGGNTDGNTGFRCAANSE